MRKFARKVLIWAVTLLLSLGVAAYAEGPTETPTVNPTAQPTPTVNPTAQSTPTVNPTAQSTPTANPTAQPTPTVNPTAQPTPTVNPTATPEPTATPVPTAAQPIKIYASAGEGGEISPSGNVEVASDALQCFTIEPKDGFAVEEVFVDGESVGPVETYVFQDVAEDHTIWATFVRVASRQEEETPVVFALTEEFAVLLAQAEATRMEEGSDVCLITLMPVAVYGEDGKAERYLPSGVVLKAGEDDREGYHRIADAENELDGYVREAYSLLFDREKAWKSSYIVNTHALNMRPLPTMDYDPIWLAREDDEVCVLGTDRGWCLIVTGDGHAGYVAAMYLSPKES